MCDHTWKLQSEAGFLYDSSWGYTKDIGYKENKVAPFFPLKSSKEFCEIPLVIMDFPFVNMINKWSRFEEICIQCENANGYLVVNFHNNNYNKLDFPDVAKDYEELIKRLSDKKAYFVTLGQAYKEIINVSSN